MSVLERVGVSKSRKFAGLNKRKIKEMFASHSQKHSPFERIWSRKGKLCNRLADSIEAFYRNSLLVDLAEATASGLCVSVVLTMMQSDSMEGIQLNTLIKTTFFTLSCFFAAALLVHYLWQGRLRLMVPSWILIPMLGTMLSSSFIIIPAIITGWSYPYKSEKTMLDYALRWWKDIGFFLSLIFIITTPITAVIHHLGYLLKWMRH